MAWHRPGDKPLFEPMMVRLLTHIGVTWPHWVTLAGSSYILTIWAEIITDSYIRSNYCMYLVIALLTLVWWCINMQWYAVLDILFNTLRPRQNGCHFADDTFKRIFLNENVIISIQISLKFVPKGPINNIPALVQIMAWRWPGDKPLSEAMIVSLLTHICITRPQWVNRTQLYNKHLIWCRILLELHALLMFSCVSQFAVGLAQVKLTHILTGYLTSIGAIMWWPLKLPKYMRRI